MKPTNIKVRDYSDRMHPCLECPALIWNKSKRCLKHANKYLCKTNPEYIKRRTATRMEKLRLGLLKPPTLGRKMTDEEKLRHSKALIGRKMPKEFGEAISRRLKGNTTCGVKTWFKCGPAHPNWKGGVYTFKKCLSAKVRSTGKHTRLREKVLLRDGRACVLCKSKDDLEVDHIIPVVYYLNKYKAKTIEEAVEIEELWNENNLRTLCKYCHEKTETFASRAKTYTLTP